MCNGAIATNCSGYKKFKYIHNFLFRSGVRLMACLLKSISINLVYFDYVTDLRRNNRSAGSTAHHHHPR